MGNYVNHEVIIPKFTIADVSGVTFGGFGVDKYICSQPFQSTRPRGARLFTANKLQILTFILFYRETSLFRLYNINFSKSLLQILSYFKGIQPPRT